MGTREDQRQADSPPLRRAGRWLAGGSFAAAHACAALVALTCFVIVPAGLFTLLFLVGLLVAVVTNGDPGGPLFYPFGVFFIVAVGCASALAVAGLGLVADLLRRGLRWPRWTPPAAVALCAFVAALGGALSADVAVVLALAWALLAGTLCTVSFLTYWLPLVLVDAAQGLVARLARFVGAALRGRRGLAVLGRVEEG